MALQFRKEGDSGRRVDAALGMAEHHHAAPGAACHELEDLVAQRGRVALDGVVGVDRGEAVVEPEPPSFKITSLNLRFLVGHPRVISASS